MIKNDIATEAFMTNLYAAYAVESVPQFKATCVEAVNSLAGNAGKKAGFISDLNRLNSKDRMVKKVTDFVMAGQGFKVL